MPGPFTVDPFTDLALDDDPDVDGCVATITRTSGFVTGISWADSVTGQTIKTVSIARAANNQVTSITTSVYLQDGVTIGSQKVETLARTTGKVSSVTVTRPV